MMTSQKKIKLAFFGTSHIAVFVLEALKRAGFMPELIVTVPEKKVGKTLESAASAAALWGERHNIPVATDWNEFETGAWDVAIIVDYYSQKRIPQRASVASSPRAWRLSDALGNSWR